MTPLCQASCRESEYPRELVYALLGFASSPQPTRSGQAHPNLPNRVKLTPTTRSGFVSVRDFSGFRPAHAGSVFKVGWGERREPQHPLSAESPRSRESERAGLLIVGLRKLTPTYPIGLRKLTPTTRSGFVSARDFASFRSAKPTNLVKSSRHLYERFPIPTAQNAFFRDD